MLKLCFFSGSVLFMLILHEYHYFDFFSNKNNLKHTIKLYKEKKKEHKNPSKRQKWKFERLSGTTLRVNNFSCKL